MAAELHQLKECCTRTTATSARYPPSPELKDKWQAELELVRKRRKPADGLVVDFRLRAQSRASSGSTTA